MADKTGIEWTQATWNPIVGCSIVSPGCTNCYAMKQAARIERMHEGAYPNGAKSHYADTTKIVNGNTVWTGKLAFAPERIFTQPLRWKRPRTIFVNSMGDLFHEDVPDYWIDKIFAIMALCPQHTFQVLTKRADRMRRYVNQNLQNGCGLDRILGNELLKEYNRARHEKRKLPVFALPLPNVWLGVSTEDQKRADERIPELLATPAAVRFISAEPLLGAIDLRFRQDHCDLCGGTGMLARWPKGTCYHCKGRGTVTICGQPRRDGYVSLDWVIVGGESGPGARPMHPDWARGLRNQCAAAGVSFFFKQWGAYQPQFPQYPSEYGSDEDVGTCAGKDFPFEGVLYRDGYFYDGVEHQPHINSGAYWIERVGKKSAGRQLDGREHNDMPALVGAA